MKLTDIKIFKSYYWSDLWYRQVSARISPRNKWLTSVIPREHYDKDHLMELVLFKCLTEYCETEMGLDWLFSAKYDKDYPAQQIKFEKELKTNYLLLTKKLPELEKDLVKEWDSIPKHYLFQENKDKFDYNKVYGKIDQTEVKIRNLKTKICLWIVLNRTSLWT
jgi:hypothetical protein